MTNVLDLLKNEFKSSDVIERQISTDVTRIADALERIATILESNVHISIDHAHIDEIDHNHVEGKIHTHEDKW